MGRKKIEIDKNVLERLYIKENLSPYKIGMLLNCSFSTVSNKIKEYGIALKSKSFAQSKYPKTDFDGSLVLKAYMLGFRLGDLSVRKVSDKSETIVVRCHTTQRSQLSIIKNLFKKYGGVKVSEGPGGFHINCYLNRSFDFLLPKDGVSWRWVNNNKEYAMAFIAGYTDAEGNFILNQKRARFKIDSYDFEILCWASCWLSANNIPNKLRCIYAKGSFSYYNGKTWNHNLWRLNINEALPLQRFIMGISKFLMHSKRIRDAKICLKNIEKRKSHGTIR